jgi:putative endonuclease
MKESTVYIMANERNGTIYVGVSSNLIQRVWQHKNHLADGFTKKYKITTLVYFEQALTIESAIAREKELKGWSREKKIFLIEEKNPYWMDLYDSIV